MGSKKRKILFIIHTKTQTTIKQKLHRFTKKTSNFFTKRVDSTHFKKYCLRKATKYLHC